MSVRRVRGAALALAVWGVALIGAPSAGATTFCVLQNSSACPSGTIAPSLEAAMQTLASDGSPDTVLLEANNYFDMDSFQPTGSDPLTIQGAGKTQTALISNSNAQQIVLNLAAGANSRAIVVRDLEIRVTDNLPNVGVTAAQISGDGLINVDIQSLNPASDGIVGVQGAFVNGRIYATGAGTIDSGVEALGAGGGQLTLEGVSIESAEVPVRIDAGAVNLNLANSRISTRPGSFNPAINLNGGTATVRNTVLLTSGTEALLAVGDPSFPTALTADHVTAVNSGGTNPAIEAFVGPGNQNASVTVTNSILRGYPLSFERTAPVGVGGDAFVTARYSNLVLPSSTPGTETNSGDGALDFTTGNIDSDPLFVSALDLSLQPSSPSIDLADPASTLSPDILGAPRPNDGNGDGTARADQGAFEFQRAVTPPPTADTTPPQTKKGKGPKAKITARKATFRFSSSEAGSRFQCKFDKRAYAGCKSPRTYKKLKLGKHVLLVRAIDAAGNVDKTPVKFTFRVVRPKR